MKKKSVSKLCTSTLLTATVTIGSLAGTFLSSHTVSAAPNWYNEAYQEIYNKGVLYGGKGYDELSLDQKKELHDGIQRILKSLNLTGDKFNDAAKIDDYVVTHVTDSPESKNYKYRYSAYGAYKGQAVCMGYAYFYSALCNAAGITCWIVLTPDHAWNIVEINGKQYACDTRYDSYAREFYGQKGNIYCLISPESYEKLSGNKGSSIYRADQNIYSIVIDSPYSFSELPY